MNEVQRQQFQDVSRMLIAGFSSSIPTEDELRGRLEMFRSFGSALSDQQFAEIFDEVSKVLSIEMDLGFVLERKGHKPWLADRRTLIDWRLWNAYALFQTSTGRPALLVDRLGQALDSILDHVGDPAETSPWARRGLVIGNVQSGKTGTYIGLMDKAADAGYKVFIVLTGNTESLRQQTQARVDEGLIGSDTLFVSEKAGVANDANKRIGVGKYLESVSSTVSLTTMTTDFRKSTADGVNISAAEDRLIVFITKKNKTVLDRIALWLGRQDKVDGKIQLPLLLIDDESDFASVNTRDPDEEPTAINAAIVKILGLFHRSSYVGFTATPFANIFIDDDKEEDLFPRDFIYGLEAPTNYVGPQSLFGVERIPDEDDPIHILEDAEECFPVRHKSSFEVTSLPDSLHAAIRVFLLSNAIRDLRGQTRDPRSMLVNVSRYNKVQKQVWALVGDVLAEYRNAIQLHSRAYESGISNGVIREFEETFDDEYRESGVEWIDVLRTLASSVSGIEVRLVNSQSDKKLEQDLLIDTPPPRTIAIGGDLLSRGLTLEGLTISYFYRHTAASDTLMQMGRWFGYRTGYGDLCRIWIDSDMSAAFAYAADSMDELRLELQRMQSQRLTPEQYGLAVAKHPGALLITARNKMRAASTGQKQISLRGRSIETYMLPADSKITEKNLATANSFIERLVAEHGTHSLARKRPIWRGVPKAFIADFLEEYEPHENLHLFQRGALEKFVRSAVADDLQDWDVVLVGGTGRAEHVGSIPLSLAKRRFGAGKDNSWLVSDTKQRVAGRGDVATGMDVEKYRAIEERYVLANPEKKSAPDSEFTWELERPVLLIYPLQPEADKVKLEGTHIAIKIALPGDRGDGDLSVPDEGVTYILNSVAQKLWFPEFAAATVADDDDV